MDYLHRHAPKRYRPAELVPKAQSIIFVALNYYRAMPARAADLGYREAAGRIARYAQGRDYHKVLGKRLKRVAAELRRAYPAEEFRPFTDATPLSERVYAARGGVGFHGRNTLLIHPELGSWFLLGEIVTSVQLEPSSYPEGPYPYCPPGCRRCIQACPTGAIYAPHRMDARRCISYLSIEHQGGIEPALRRRMQDWVFGCDRCQEVCPLNRRVAETSVGDFRRDNAGPFVPLRELLQLSSDDEVRERFAGSPLLRAKRRGLVRNACIAAANLGARDELPIIRELTQDHDQVVREHAAWALARLRTGAR
jgi:epoxyqueuosine reductase